MKPHPLVSLLHSMKRSHIPATIALLALTLLPAATAQAKPLKVYILAGQSNMQGYATVDTLAGMKADPTSRALHDKIVHEDGSSKEFEDVRISAVSGKVGHPVVKNGKLTLGYGGWLDSKPGASGKYALKFGPEMGFGVTMREHLKEPFLIIKAAWGGKSLRQDFLPPSGVKIVGEDAQTGAYYKMMCDHVGEVLADPGKYHPAYDPQQGFEIAGFVWFQGFNDMVSDKEPLYQPTETRPAFAAYSDLLACFIRDVRKDLKAPDMPFVIGVIGTGGKPEQKSPFREAMAAPAALPEFKGTVTAVHTAEYFDEKLGELDDRGWRWQRPGWDPENKYADLRAKLAPLQKELNEAKGIEDPKQRSAKQSELNRKIRDITYTQDEQEYIAMNKSNQGYHYLGSGKILGRIGEAFAKAMITLEKQP